MTEDPNWSEEAVSRWGHPPTWFRSREDGQARSRRIIHLPLTVDEALAALREAAAGLTDPEVAVETEWESSVLAVEGWREPAGEEREVLERQRALADQQDRISLADLRARRPELF